MILYQGEWRRTPYRSKPYVVLSAYELAEPGLQGADELWAKLLTTLHGGCDGAACSQPLPESIGQYSDVTLRFASDCPCLAASIECDQRCGCTPEACANRPVASGRMLTVGREVEEKDVWGIDCYTRRNVHDAIMEAESPLLANVPEGGRRSIAENFVERMLLPTLNTLGEHGADMMRALQQIESGASGVAGCAPSPIYSTAAGAVAARMRQTGQNYFRVHPKARTRERPGGISASLSPFPANLWHDIPEQAR